MSPIFAFVVAANMVSPIPIADLSPHYQFPTQANSLEKEESYKETLIREWHRRKQIVRPEYGHPVFPQTSPYGRGYALPPNPRFLPQNTPWAPRPYYHPDFDY